MKGYSSRQVIRLLKKDGWFEVSVVGSHHQFKHPSKRGRVTVKHPVKDIPQKPWNPSGGRRACTFLKAP